MMQKELPYEGIRQGVKSYFPLNIRSLISPSFFWHTICYSHNQVLRPLKKGGEERYREHRQLPNDRRVVIDESSLILFDGGD